MAEAAAIGLVVMAVANVVKGVSAANQANAEADARELQAREVDIKAMRDERLLRKRGREFMGEQTARYAASGVASLEGSPLLALEDTLASIEEEAMAIRHGADFRAGQLFRSASALRQKANDEAIATAFGVGGNILTGAAQYDSINDPNSTAKTEQGAFTMKYNDYFSQKNPYSKSGWSR